MTIDARAWSKRNIARRASGEVAVRPGLRRMATPTAGRRWVGGFSVVSPWSLEVWHYVADVDTAGAGLIVRILDEDFVQWQAFTTGVDAIPRGFSHAVVEGELLIGSPDMPTLYGLVGSGIGLAAKVASVNPSTTALAIPRGVVTHWNNRAVLCDGANMYVSDGVSITTGTVRTFVGQNINQRPGVIFGVHEGAGGLMVVVTSAGVYGLDGAAAAVAIVGNSGTDWRMLHHAQAFSYDSSCVVRGRVYALTSRGYALVDVENDREELLDEPLCPRRFGARISSLDWRTARMLPGDDGPLVAAADQLSVHDLASPSPMRSWWSCGVNATWRVRGVLRDVDGGVMLLAEDGIYAIGGNVDGGQLLSSEAATQPKGIFCGEIPASPAESPTARDVQASAALGGVGNIVISVRGDTGMVAAPTPAADNRSLVIGTSSWGGVAPNGAAVVYQPTPLASARWQGDMASDDITVEFGAEYPDTRIRPVLDDGNSKSAPRRPVGRGN